MLLYDGNYTFGNKFNLPNQLFVMDLENLDDKPLNESSRTVDTIVSIGELSEVGVDNFLSLFVP